MAFTKNLFINCPFDDDYYPLLRPLLFTAIYCDLKPQISETKDGDDIRIRQIQELIENSKFSIHDLSRIEPKSSGDLPRFNMPLELGIDLGCKRYLHTAKRCLILEAERYRYKEVISDLLGQDISCHENDPMLMIKAVRDWIYKLRTFKNKPENYTVIWDKYNEFIYDYDKDMKAENLNTDRIWEIPFTELIDHMAKWIKTNKRNITNAKKLNR